MSNKNLLNITANAFSEIKAWKTATLVLGAVCAILAFALIDSARTTPVVLLPYSLATMSEKMSIPLNGEIKDTSQEYIANIALSDLNLILNFTPENAYTQTERFLNRLDETLYGNSSEQLRAAAKSNKDHGVTQSFNPTAVDIQIDGKKVNVYVSGTQIQYAASKEYMRSTIKYKITYTQYKGFLHVTDLRPEESKNVK